VFTHVGLVLQQTLNSPLIKEAGQVITADIPLASTLYVPILVLVKLYIADVEVRVTHPVVIAPFPIATSLASELLTQLVFITTFFVAVLPLQLVVVLIDVA
jgi:hypothetical protein